jgi:hypothetical protein
MGCATLHDPSATLILAIPDLSEPLQAHPTERLREYGRNKFNVIDVFCDTY